MVGQRAALRMPPAAEVWAAVALPAVAGSAADSVAAPVWAAWTLVRMLRTQKPATPTQKPATLKRERTPVRQTLLQA